MEEEITRRSEGIFQAFTGTYFDTNLLAVHCGIVGLTLFSFFSMLLIYYFFEKTQSPEIFFVIFFAASCSLEALRFILPLGRVYEIPSLYLLMAGRIILFCRYFGIFSLVTASVYAAGFRAQKQGNVMMIITVTTLIITVGVPIDTEAWNSNLTMVYGYGSLLRLVEAGTFFLATISFFIAAWSRSSREFAFIGVGSALIFLGRNILLNADTWAGLTGLLFLIIGVWLICIMLHKIYLWL
jgi:hypothetical protein